MNPATLVFAVFSALFAVFSDLGQSGRNKWPNQPREGEGGSEGERERERETERPQPEDPDEPSPLNPQTQPVVKQSPWRQVRGEGVGPEKSQHS